MRKQSQQVEQGDVIGNWTVVSEQPARNTSTGKLEWEIECVEAHRMKAEHSALSYGVVPQQCGQCVQQEINQRIAAKAEEKRVIKSAAAEISAAQRERIVAQREQQISGIADPNKPFGYIRAIQITQQQEGEVNAV